MDELTEDAVREIEKIHSNWIEFEVAGEDHNLMALCADDIELWPPDAQPLLGRAAVSAQMAHATTTIYSIEITHRRVRGSNELAYLTASYKTTFSSAEDLAPRQAIGSPLLSTSIPTNSSFRFPRQSGHNGEWWAVFRTSLRYNSQLKHSRFRPRRPLLCVFSCHLYLSCLQQAHVPLAKTQLPIRRSSRFWNPISLHPSICKFWT